MCSPLMVSRLDKINQDLAAICKLQKMENFDNENVRQSRSDLSKEMYRDIEFVMPEISIKHKKMKNNRLVENQSEQEIERSLKDFSNERKRRKELEKELGSIMTTVKLANERTEKQAVFLKDALKKVEGQANAAADLGKQCELMRRGRDDLLNQVSQLKRELNEATKKNVMLHSTYEELNEALEVERRKVLESSGENGKMRSALEAREIATEMEKRKCENIIAQLTNIVKARKKREVELIGICDEQRLSLHQKDREIAEKEEELKKVKGNLTLAKSLEDKAKMNKDLQEELRHLKETNFCEQKIKEKIILDKNDTIEKQKKLLQESSELVLQITRELKQLQSDFRFEKETNDSLKKDLETVRRNSPPCVNCDALKEKMEHVNEQKQTALLTAKYTAEKLHRFSLELQQATKINMRDKKLMTNLLNAKEAQMEQLKQEVLRAKNQPRYLSENAPK